MYIIHVYVHECMCECVCVIKNKTYFCEPIVNLAIIKFPQ